MYVFGAFGESPSTFDDVYLRRSLYSAQLIFRHYLLVFHPVVYWYINSNNNCHVQLVYLKTWVKSFGVLLCTYATTILYSNLKI